MGRGAEQITSRHQQEAYWRREAEQAQQDARRAIEKQNLIKRRKFLEWSLGLGIGAVAAVKKLGELDVALGEVIYDETQTRLQPLDECANWYPPKDGEPPSREAFITVPGLGITNGFAFAWPMGLKALGLPDSDIPMSYLFTSHKGKTPEDVALVINDELENSEEQSFYCPSNGGPTLFEALHILKEHGVIVRPKRIILNCAPYDFSDGRSNFFQRAMAEALHLVKYKGGPISKGIFQLHEQISRRGLFEGMYVAAKEAWSGSPPTPWLQDLYNLQEVRLNEYDFTDILTEETEIVFLKARRDPIVLNDQASGKYKELAGRYGAKYTEITMDDRANHADPIVASEDRQLQAWIAQTDPRHRLSPTPV